VVGGTVVVVAASVDATVVGVSVVGTVSPEEAALWPLPSEHAATTAAAPIAKNTRRDTGLIDAVCRIDSYGEGRVTGVAWHT